MEKAQTIRPYVDNVSYLAQVKRVRNSSKKTPSENSPLSSPVETEIEPLVRGQFIDSTAIRKLSIQAAANMGDIEGTSLVVKPYVIRSLRYLSRQYIHHTKIMDIDILVNFLPDAKVTLFKYVHMVNDLQELTGKKIDLVENGQIKEFATTSIDTDKILIYERKAKG